MPYGVWPKDRAHKQTNLFGVLLGMAARRFTNHCNAAAYFANVVSRLLPHLSVALHRPPNTSKRSTSTDCTLVREAQFDLHSIARPILDCVMHRHRSIRRLQILNVIKDLQEPDDNVQDLCTGKLLFTSVSVWVDQAGRKGATYVLCIGVPRRQRAQSPSLICVIPISLACSLQRRRPRYPHGAAGNKLE